MHPQLPFINKYLLETSQNRQIFVLLIFLAATHPSYLTQIPVTKKYPFAHKHYPWNRFIPSIQERQSVLLATAQPAAEEQKDPASSPISQTHYFLKFR